MLSREVLRDVSNVELSLRLVVVGKVRLLLLASVAAQDFLRAHHLLDGCHLVCWRGFIEATRKIALSGSLSNWSSAGTEAVMRGRHPSFLLTAAIRAVAAAATARPSSAAALHLSRITRLFYLYYNHYPYFL